MGVGGVKTIQQIDVKRGSDRYLRSMLERTGSTYVCESECLDATCGRGMVKDERRGIALADLGSRVSRQILAMNKRRRRRRRLATRGWGAVG